MRRLLLAPIASLALLAPASASAGAAYKAHVSGGAGVLEFDHVDGCIETTGQIAGLDVRGPGSEGSYALVIGFVIDLCHPDAPWGAFVGGVDGKAFTAKGLEGGSMKASIETWSYDGLTNPPVVAIDLTFKGQGAVTNERQSFKSTGPGGTTLSFSSTSSRAASLSGSLTIGSTTIATSELHNGTLFQSTSGELVVIPKN